MPNPGGPRVRFLVLAGCFSFRAASPLSPPFIKLLPPPRINILNTQLYTSSPHAPSVRSAFCGCAFVLRWGAGSFLFPTHWILADVADLCGEERAEVTFNRSSTRRV
jgi:hypothetical protein